MKAATLPRDVPHDALLLHVDRRARALRDRRLIELPHLLEPGDLLVINDAGTLPASLRSQDKSYELRLIGWNASDDTWRAFLLGAGDHRVPTEERGPPPEVSEGQILNFEAGLCARVSKSRDERGFLRIKFNLEREQFFQALYKAARPIQYAYVARPVELWDVQNRYASAPWAFESPSAGYGFTWELLGALKKRGIRWAWLTHAAGVSSTGRELDRSLPIPERYSIPETTVLAIRRAQRERQRVIAIGTTVVRALESNLREHGKLRAGIGEAELIIGPGFQRRIVDSLITGMHERTTSHYALLQAFADDALLEQALRHAERKGYLQHEYGDVCLIQGQP